METKTQTRYKVFVTDAGTNAALAVTRSLAKAGIEVTCGETTKRSKSFYSKYCTNKVIYPSPSTEPDRFIEYLLNHLEEKRYDVLFPITDPTILCVLKKLKEFKSCTKIPIKNQATQMKALDKSQTIKLASRINVPVPNTYFIRDISGLKEISETVNYPVIIKPKQSSFWYSDRIVSGSTVFINTEKDLIEKYQDMHERMPDPLIQEYIGGEEVGVYMLIQKGEPKALFSLKRLRSYNPYGGASVLRESIKTDSKIKEYALRLLRELNWEGVAMVEFKIDSRDNTPKLMEVNGRFWGSLQAPIACGVDFPYLLFNQMMDKKVEPVLDYQKGIQCRYLLGDFVYLLKVLRGDPDSIIEYPKKLPTLINFLKFKRPNLVYDNLSFDDPNVGVRTWLDFIMSFSKHLRET
ncbi:MAG: ATP-grasp domain-containing protein [Thermoplasmata archaeon]|nr:MAG: ATP-grasp domain-containing protein [Thermoplasmata archaeon]